MKQLLIIISLLIAYQTNAQTVKVLYEERANIENQLKHVTDPETRKRVSAHLSKPANFVLYYKSGESLYVSDNEISAESEELDLKSNRKEKNIEIGKEGGGIYKNPKSNEYLQEADILGKKFLVKDTLEKYNWILTDEEKQIGTYKVKKAKATINGEEIIVWYALEIPIADGPKEYYGLPGLIIELIAEKKTYHAIQIITKTTIPDFIKPSKGETVNKTKYNQILNQKLNELKQGIGNSINH